MDESDPPTYTGVIDVSFTASADDVPDGYGPAVYEVQTNTGTDGAFTSANADAVEDDDSAPIPG